LLGAGGSLLTLPLLVYGLGMEPRPAIAASLVVVGVTSLAGAALHARRGGIDVRAGTVFGLAGMAGAYLGGRAAGLLPAGVLLFTFAIVMLAAAIAMLRPRRDPPATRTPDAGRAVVLGGAVGLVAGLVGAGGGFLIVPALTHFGGLALRKAIGTSLMVIAMQSAAGLAGHAAHASVPWALVGGVTAVAVVGATLGARVASRVSPSPLRRGFAWLVLGAAALQLANAVPWRAASSMLILRASMHDFTPIPALLGGVLIGLAASLLLFTHGKVAGISGIFGQLLRAETPDRAFRTFFVLGLVASGVVAALARPAAIGQPVVGSLALLGVAGVLVGLGTRIGGGCTSGHGVCGMSRLSVRSVIATMTFMATGFATTYLLLHVFGGSS
jgi:hypothetical protein